jgi:hypothetical protein
MASRSSPKLNQPPHRAASYQPKRLDNLTEIGEACARFAVSLGDNPSAIAAAVMAEMDASDPAATEKRRVIEQFLTMSLHVHRQERLM